MGDDKTMTVIVVGGADIEERARLRQSLLEATGKDSNIRFQDAVVTHSINGVLVASAALDDDRMNVPYYVRTRSKKQKRQRPR